MKFSLFGRLAMALFASLTLGLGMTACGGGTIGYMWVLGSQYNQIAGFKIDDYTGNLTQVQGSPFPSNGSNPVSIVLKPGGRYVYVINQGSGGSANGAGAGQSVAVYSVGGDGVLTFQQSYQTQGYVSQWAQFDSTGTYLYVLDKYSPGYVASSNLYNGPNTDGNGAITAFTVDGTTGRLSLVTNSQTLRGGINTPFFEVGPTPIMMKSQGGCLFTLNSSGNSVTPYTFASGGQLALTTTGTFPISGASQLTSINGGGSYIYFTDAANGSAANYVLQYTVGSSCTLAATTGNRTLNYSGTFNPTNSLVDSTGAYVYVLNSTATSTNTSQSFSSVSAWHVNSVSGQLETLSGAPYTTGADPVCMVEDPSNQYMYISNHNDGTVTGKVFDPTHGFLSDLSRGSTFTSAGLAGCLVVSGAVN
jgi:6-phosphogluconolactonase (cycloisomerase 2 family)